jgi:chromosome segregation ATPase
LIFKIYKQPKTFQQHFKTNLKNLTMSANYNNFDKITISSKNNENDSKILKKLKNTNRQNKQHKRENEKLKQENEKLKQENEKLKQENEEIKQKEYDTDKKRQSIINELVEINTKNEKLHSIITIFENKIKNLNKEKLKIEIAYGKLIQSIENISKNIYENEDEDKDKIKKMMILVNDANKELQRINEENKELKRIIDNINNPKEFLNFNDLPFLQIK